MQSRSREDVIQQDIKDLHQLGYAQELFRTMGGFSNFAISFSIISILTGAVILYDYGLAWAGTAAVLIGWPLVTVFVLTIAASMAEIASAYPTAGGLYYWASKMKNKNWGWWTAWFNLIGQFAIVSGINFAAAFFLNQTIISPLTNNGFTNTTEVLKIGDTLLISGQLLTMAVLMLGQLVLNIVGIRIVAMLNQVSVWWHIVFVILIAGSLFLLGTKSTEVDSGLKLFAIQPQDTLGSWDITVPPGSDKPWFSFLFGAANTYPVFLAFFFSLLLANWTYTGLRRVGPRRRGDGRRARRERLGPVPLGRRLGGRRVHLPARADAAPAGSHAPLRAAGRPGEVQPVLLRRQRRGELHPHREPRGRARRAVRWRHRHRHEFLRPVLGGLGRTDAVCLRP